MSIISWLIVGGLIGWLTTMVMRADAQQGLVLNVAVGMVGALLGGWFLSPLFGVIATINQSVFSIPRVFVAVLGAVILLAAGSCVRRGTVR
jgi:uncharacterized membrane protein YeaQ/YmgE (transglycosylase-associated protein family)